MSLLDYNGGRVLRVNACPVPRQSLVREIVMVVKITTLGNSCPAFPPRPGASAGRGREGVFFLRGRVNGSRVVFLMC